MPTYREIREQLAPHYRFADDEDRMLRLIVRIPEADRVQGVTVY